MFRRPLLPSPCSLVPRNLRRDSGWTPDTQVISLLSLTYKNLCLWSKFKLSSVDTHVTP